MRVQSHKEIKFRFVLQSCDIYYAVSCIIYSVIEGTRNFWKELETSYVQRKTLMESS